MAFLTIARGERKIAIRVKTYLMSIFIFFFLTVLPSPGQDNENNEKYDFSHLEINVVLTDAPIQLDGFLKEMAWQKCEPITELLQQDPDEGKPVSEKTEIRILYNKTHLYIGVICFDSEPEKIVARKLKRSESDSSDPIFSDDSFHILLDPFANGQNAFMFSTNPLGARYDALIAGFNRSSIRSGSERRQAATPQPSWNGLWNVKSTMLENGWSAEFEIPFSTLRFPNQTEQKWGVNFKRIISRKNEEALWSSHYRYLGFYSLIHTGMLEGLTNLEQGLGIDFKPYIFSNYSIQRDPDHDEDMMADAGFDLSYSITSDIRMDVAVNPDFAETEVDEQPLNLERFPLFFPEKRRFFLEGSNIFDIGSSQRVIPYHSRRIGLDENRQPLPIIEGTKITGALDQTSFGFMNALTQSRGNTPSTMFNVMRLQQRVLDESNLGMIVTSKLPDGGPANHLIGMDGSFTTYPFQDERTVRTNFLAMQTISDIDNGDGFASHAAIVYPNDPWDLTFEYLHVDPDFNPELGFVRQKGLERWDFDIVYTPEIDGINWLRRTVHSVQTKYSVDEDFTQFQDYIRITPLGMLFESGDYFEYEFRYEGDNVLEPFEIFQDISVRPDRYRDAYHELTFRSALHRLLSIELQYSFGEFLNGSREAFEVEAILQASKHVSFALEGEIDHRVFPVSQWAGETYGGDFTANLARFRVTYAFNPNMYITSFLQWENESELASLNTRFQWTIEPERDVFLVLNLSGDRETNTFIQADTAIKIGYNWRF